MRNLTSVLALGELSFKAYRRHLAQGGLKVRGMRFAHGAVYTIRGAPTLYVSYHPSPRNTNTGKLSPAMLSAVLERIKGEFPK